MYLVRTPNADAAKRPGYTLQSFLRRPAKKDLLFYPRPNEFIRASLTPQFVKVLGVVIIKWLKPIGKNSTFIEHIFAVISYWLVFGETLSSAAKHFYLFDLLIIDLYNYTIC